MHSPGTVLAGRYRLDERLGAGGMGEVWRATDQQLQRTVAIKVMQPGLLDDPGFAARFHAEARTMAGITHPGVVGVHDYQHDDAGGFLVMDYVEGEPLSQVLARQGHLPAAHTMQLVAQAADALEAAHARGVVHRDVKPANLLVRGDGTIVLTDFGIARAQAGTQLTATGAVLGTPSYLAPEQAHGEPATPRSDVYALGAVAYECLTGRRPFDRDNPFATAVARDQEAPPTLAGDIPPGVAAVVERALAPDPAHRWPSAAELATACRRAATDPYAQPVPVTSAAPGPPAGPGPGSPSYGTVPPQPVPPPRPRRGLALAITGGALGVLVVATGIVLAFALVVPDLVDGAGDEADPSPQPAAASMAPGCERFADYGVHQGATVQILNRAANMALLVESLEPFMDCTGITVEYEGAGFEDFEALLETRVAGGDPPDLAFLFGPRFMAELVGDEALVPAPAAVTDHAEAWLPAQRDYATVDGTLYGVPLDSYVSSLVWYSPAFFADNGYEIPQTWDQLVALSDEIADTGVKPWCAGAEGPDSVTTRWVGDALLRLNGPEVYEQWWRHEIPFDDPRVIEALDLVGSILKNEDYVNGGFGGVDSIADVPYSEAGLPILDEECAMHRQDVFYANVWPDDTVVAEGGDAWAFSLPPVDPSAGRPVLGFGNLTVGFDDRPAVQAVHTYLASTHLADARLALGDGWTTTHQGVDPADGEDPIDRLQLEIFQEPGADFHYSGSELLPPEVHSVFETEMAAWLTGQDSQTTATNVESAWP